MARNIVFYTCPTCHSVIELIENGGHSLVCCDQPMRKLSVKEKGKESEYHLPQLKHRDGLLYVNVGSKPHPQSEDHHIEFILFVTKQTVRRSDIKSNSMASTVFTDKDHGDVYAYCSKHGLWKTSF